jgi:hypothetical protein
MNFYSTSMIAPESLEKMAKPLSKENQAVSMEIPNQRRTSRSGVRNADAWVRKRALMHRGYQWTTTFEGAETTNNDELSAEDRFLTSKTESLPTSSANSLTYTDPANSSSSSTAMMASSTHVDSISRHHLHRRRSSRRLPEIPPQIATSHHHSSHFNEISFTDEIVLPEYSYQPIRDNSISRRSTRSKSIDSDSSIKLRSSQLKLLHTHQSPNAQSIDISNLARQKASLVVNNTLLPQRSIDYPCIVRKAPDLSDIVRRRMLYSKISKQQGESFSHSLEREHVPRVPRKIIIRQDNSIEIALR